MQTAVQIQLETMGRIAGEKMPRRLDKAQRDQVGLRREGLDQQTGPMAASSS